MFAKSNPNFSHASASDNVSIPSALSSPLYDAQARSTYRAAQNAIPRSCSQRLPCLPCALVQRQAAIRPVCVATLTSRVRQPIQQAQECGLAPVPHSKAFHRSPSAYSATAVHIQRELHASPRLTPTYVHISLSDMTLTPTCNRRSALRIHRLERLFYLRINGIRLDARNLDIAGIPCLGRAWLSLGA